jgi:hypothetical protein
MNETTPTRAPIPPWTLVTSHGLVLLYVVTNPDATIRQIAEQLEYTERRIADIVRDLEVAGMVDVTRIGRRNHYKLRREAHFRHPFVSNVPFESFVNLWRRRNKGAAQDVQA